MRKISILFALAAIVAAVCSCNQEGYQENSDEGNDVISFVMKSIETRSESSPTLANYTYRLGTSEDGTIFNLEETVTDLYAAEPETKGTPAYTENYATLYGGFSGLIYGQTGNTVAGDESFQKVTNSGKENVWRRVLGFDPWLSNDALTFFLRMPASQSGVSNLSYSVTGGPSIEFDYTSPSSATAQQDILFATRTVDKTTYDRELARDGGADILFRHALTGVKFAIGNNTTDETTGRTPSGQVETFITKVVVKGLKNSGHAVFIPDNTEESNTDVTDTYSSDGSITWTYGTGTGTFTQTYTDSDIQDFASGDAVNGPSSFYAAGADRNLNKANGSLTFWFIPQEITEDLTLSVTFYIWDGTKKSANMTLDLDLGTRILATSGNADINGFWKAGQLRTFSLKPTNVDVEITDEVEGSVKKNVVIKNTGNKDAYLRVVIVGNWVNNKDEIVAPWDETQGTFNGGALGGDASWDHTGGYWYYKNKVQPGKSPAVNIFTTYTRPTTVPAGATKLIMDISVQAVDAAAGANYALAWAATSTGEDDSIPVPPSDDDSTGDGE